MIIDTHAHLLSPGVETEEIIRSMKADGLEKIVNIGTDAADSEAGVSLAKKVSDVYATVGIHPEYASIVTDEDIEKIDKLASEKKVVAIGEIGLDYHIQNDNIERQKEVFIKQIKIAKKHSLPICIHSRDAREDTYEIVKKYKDDIVFPSIMHCFSENEEYMKKFIDLGFYISFSGNVTYKKSDISFINKIPLDKILVETDSPYLAPVPVRGTKNVPANVKYTAQKLADIYEMSYEEFVRHTVENAYRVYKGMKK